MAPPVPSPNRVVQQVQVAGGNLFALAAQYLGDATQWSRIADLNGMLDPMITGTVTLLMPPFSPGAGNGGIPSGLGPSPFWTP